MSRGYRISEQEGVNLYSYSIRIVSVKMKVKFQCKMKIEMDTESLTSEVPIVDGSTFNFNQDCLLAHKSLEQDCFTLSINLITNKGAKYIAGLAFLYHQQLFRAAQTGPSSRLVVVLSKCLDPDAILQIVVKQALSNGKAKSSLPVRQSSKQRRSRHFTHGHLNIEYSNTQSRKIQVSPPHSPRNFDFSAMQNATRSEVNLPRAASMMRHYQPSVSKVQTLHKGSRSKSRRNITKYGDKSLMQSGVNIYQNPLGFPFTDRDRQSLDYGELGNSHQRGNSVYKDSYLKLKQRLKKEEQVSQKQHDKRVSLENNEANTKIEAFKFRLKCEELQKNLAGKDGNIKKLQTRIQELEKLLRGQPHRNIYQKTIQINPSQRVVTVDEDSAISALQSKVVLANRELEDLKNKMQKISRTHAEKENSLFKQIEKRNFKITKLEQELLFNASTKNTSSKNQQSLKFTLESKEKIILQLERQQQDNYRKLAESDKTNKILEKNFSDMKSQVEELNRTINLLKSQNEKIANQVQAQKNKTNMAEFSGSNLKKSVERLENQLQAMQKFKQKYHDALVQVKRLEGQRKLQQKNYENTSKLNQSSLTTLQNKYKQQTTILIKKNQELESKSMQQMLKIKELESYINSTVKHQIDNYRKNNQKLQKDCDQYRNAERMTRREYLQIEGRINQQQSEAQVWKNKFKSMQNVSKLESDKYISQLNRIKTALEQQLINSLSLKQKNQTLATELAITASKLGALDQKYNKQIKQFSSRLEMEINKCNRLQEVIKKQEMLNQESRDKEKHLMSKLEQYGENQSQYSELIKRYEHELSRIKSSLAIAQQKIITKQEQIEQLTKQLKQITQKYNTIYHKSQQQSYVIKNLQSELEKQAKQQQRLQLEITSLKMSIQNKDKTIQKQKNSLEQQAKNKMDLKEQINQYSSSYDTMAKQYERFKEHVHDMIVREFTGADGLDSLGSFQIKSRENQISLKDSIIKNKDQQSMRNSPKAQRTTYQQTKISKSTKTFNFQNAVLAYSPSSTLLNNNDIINIINQFSKESKGLLSKLIQQYRLLEKEMEESKENYQRQESKYALDAEKAELAIHQLEDQISKLFLDKEESEKKMHHSINQLEQEINKMRDEVEKSKEKLEQAMFTCNGVRMEKQTQKQFYELKMTQLNTTFKKLQHSLESTEKKYQKLQQLHSKLKSEHEDLLRECKKYKQDIQLKEKRIRQFDHELTLKSKLCEDLNLKNKAMVAQVSELELSLNSEKEKNGKNLEIISQEERKLIDTKDFVNNLIKQKQAIVKQDIANGHRILELESIKLNLEAELENTTSKLQTKIAQFATEKDNTKKLTITNRQLQTQLAIAKEHNKKLSQQLKQKEKQLSQSIQALKSKQSQHSKQIYNKNRQLQEISSTKELMEKLSSQQILNLKKQINRLEVEVIKQLKEEITAQNGIHQMISMQLDNASRSLEEKNYEINSYREIQEKLNYTRESQEQTINNLNEELRQKQEQLFQISGQLCELEQKYHQVIEKHAVQKHQIEEQFDYKYDNMCEDYETKVDEIQRERDYLKQKLLSTEEELLRNSNRLKNLEEEQNKQRLISKDRITKSEQQKNTIVNSLKMELKKVTEQKEKLAIEFKKNNTERQTLRFTETANKTLIQKLQARLKQCETKLEQAQSQAYNQVQSEKKKDLYIKQYEESVVNYQWVLQREIKKQLQNVTKSIIGSASDSSESKRRFTDAIKDVEVRISRLVNQKISPNNSRGMGN